MPPIVAVLELLNASQPAARVLPALLVTSVFGVLGYLSRGVTASGALAGATASFVIYVSLGLGGFVTLFGVFAVTWLSTRVGYAQKRRLGVAENKRGRNAGQVLANVAAAAGFAGLASEFGPIFTLAAVAALAEAAADTLSSELGEVLSGRPRMITTLEMVSAGTNGAISFPGTLAGLVSAFIIVLVAASFRVIPFQLIWIPVVAGLLGTMVDSFLGATLERSARLGNNHVNLISTIFSGMLAMTFALAI